MPGPAFIASEKPGQLTRQGGGNSFSTAFKTIIILKA
jgi:hypothetical protein